jgi:hypothetical protein
MVPVPWRSLCSRNHKTPGSVIYRTFPLAYRPLTLWLLLTAEAAGAPVRKTLSACMIAFVSDSCVTGRRQGSRSCPDRTV